MSLRLSEEDVPAASFVARAVVSWQKCLRHLGRRYDYYKAGSLKRSSYMYVDECMRERLNKFVNLFYRLKVILLTQRE